MTFRSHGFSFEKRRIELQEVKGSDSTECCSEISARILFINPSKTAGQRFTWPHMGLGYLASCLKQKGVTVNIFDMRVVGSSLPTVFDIVGRFRPNYVGITAMTEDMDRAGLVAEICKKVDPGILTILGGVHVSTLPFPTMSAFPQFDIGVIGEGEYVLPTLIEMLDRGESLDTLGGIVYRSHGAIKITALRPFIEDLDALPFPAWELFPLQLYRGYNETIGKHGLELPILTSRGCPFQCVFCARPSGSKARLRSPKNVVDEIERNYDRFKSRYLFISDENFTFNRSRVHRICHEIVDRGLDIEWWCESRVDTCDRETLVLMKKAGCYLVSFGVESGNPEILRSIKKRITLSQCESFTRTCRELGIITEAYFILGHPYETRKTAEDTISFARKLNTDRMSIGIMVPLPGTEVANMASKGEGGYRFMGKNWSDYGKIIGRALELEELPRHELEWLQIKGYIKFYLRPSRISYTWTWFDPWQYPKLFLNFFRHLVYRSKGD